MSGRLAIEAILDAAKASTNYRARFSKLVADGALPPLSDTANASESQASQVSQPDEGADAVGAKPGQIERGYAQLVGNNALLDYFRWYFVTNTHAATALSAYSASLKELAREVRPL
jgi:hypothetical protein